MSGYNDCLERLKLRCFGKYLGKRRSLAIPGDALMAMPPLPPLEP